MWILDYFGKCNELSEIMDLTEVISTKEASFYTNSGFLNTIPGVNRDYNFNNIYPDYIVLDIGACIGAFSLKIRNNVKYVYSIEPIMTNFLEKNVLLNKAKNIRVLKYALGNGNITTIDWHGVSNKIQSLQLTDLVNLCGGRIDMLKCDCEGGEWYIQSNELDNIKRVEMEIHLDKLPLDKLDRSVYNIDYFIDMMDIHEFTYYIRYLDYNLVLLSAYK